MKRTNKKRLRPANLLTVGNKNSVFFGVDTIRTNNGCPLLGSGVKMYIVLKTCVYICNKGLVSVGLGIVTKIIGPSPPGNP